MVKLPLGLFGYPFQLVLCFTAIKQICFDFFKIAAVLDWDLNLAFLYTSPHQLLNHLL